ncbi:hypothetical protein A2U01_0081542, partial [Trifolium medium]|nr:hypothetical protein [Trifolium medium]
SADSYQSVLQASSAAPHAPRPSAQPAAPPPPDAIKILHVRICYV